MLFQLSLSVWVCFWLIWETIKAGHWLLFYLVVPKGTVFVVANPSNLVHKALQYVAASFRSALPERLRGDWSLKRPKQYGGLKWESFISRRYAMFFPASWGFSGIRQGFSTDTWPTNYRHAANSRPTNGQHLAEDFRKIGKRQSADSWADCSSIFSENCLLVSGLIHLGFLVLQLMAK